MSDIPDDSSLHSRRCEDIRLYKKKFDKLRNKYFKEINQFIMYRITQKLPFIDLYKLAP
jgi:hypothetical protein